MTVLFDLGLILGCLARHECGIDLIEPPRNILDRMHMFHAPHVLPKANTQARVATNRNHSPRTFLDLACKSNWLQEPAAHPDASTQF
ncbi:hypothetical protein ASPCAL01936 [Aspergillus calidoustus]|uniref:Uncharacterized protein n=1 Tax=Aspergillus calidoustus TaxID=454130 RepID=A0A0U5GKU7_ASPCI|nr:hypothetical protein ASPCAL01936 [Aspergillus calidoustus]